jgi:hypothetical protein
MTKQPKNKYHYAWDYDYEEHDDKRCPLCGLIVVAVISGLMWAGIWWWLFT